MLCIDLNVYVLEKNQNTKTPSLSDSSNKIVRNIKEKWENKSYIFTIFLIRPPLFIALFQQI